MFRVAFACLISVFMLTAEAASSDSSAIDLKDKSLSDLLRLNVEINEELRRRKVVRTANNPTGDLAEYLFVKVFGWRQAENSQKGYDAIFDGQRYQIKGRRVHARNGSRQLGAIRDLDAFDFLAAVLFDEYYGISLAAIIPASVVREQSRYVEHTNSYRFIFRDSVMQLDGVRDVTEELRTKSGYRLD